MTVTSIARDPRERTRFLRFAVVGIIGAVVDFGTFNILNNLFDFSVVLASICSFIAAIISNFTWNRYWTYPDSRTKAVGRQLVQFTLVSVVGLAIRTVIVVFLEMPMRQLFGFIPSQSLGFIDAEFLGNNVTLAIAVIVVMFWNFFVNRYWTYNDVD